MAYLIGSIVGGVIIVLVVASLISLAFKRDEPTPRAAKSALGAFFIASLIGGLGFADGGPFAWWAAGYYLVPAGIVFAYLQWRFNKAWVDDAEEASDAFK